MATEEDAFLAAFAAHPDDRTARLAYADWLQERDDPRHELVRVCEAMRSAPVWSDRYWELKARRNELWVRCPLDWLEATGYDGSDYDPVFRDGVPDDWKGRWRLIREFVERWHGIDVPDVGSQAEVVRDAERRLGLDLSPSVREYVAFSHDVKAAGTSEHDRCLSLFHCAFYHLRHLDTHPAVGLIDFTLDDSVLGVAVEDLELPDPPAYFFSQRWDDVEFDPDGQPTPVPDAPRFWQPSLSLSILTPLHVELPTAGEMNTTSADPDEWLGRLAADFPVHAEFDDADVFEHRELLVIVSGSPDWHGRRQRRVTAILRRAVPVESIPVYLFGTKDRNTGSSGLLGPEWLRRQQEEALRRPGAARPRQWMGPRRRAPVPTREISLSPLRSYRSDEPLPPPPLPPPDDSDPFPLPPPDDSDHIPF